MGFVFPLGAVLQVRRQREQNDERAMTEAAAELREAQRTLEWVRSEIERVANEWNELPTGVVRATELRERYARVQLLERARAETEARLKRAEVLAVKRRESYLRSRQEREVLEEMEKKQRSFHEMEALRKEARRSEDLLMGRRLREELAGRDAGEGRLTG